MFYRIKIGCFKEKIVKVLVLKRNNKKVLNAIFKVPIILVRKKNSNENKTKETYSMRLCLTLSVSLYIYPAKEGGKGEVEL